MTKVLPGAEPLSHYGSPRGALLLHGFAGNPSSMRAMADAFVSAGWSVELPLLPGHGTTIDDMLTTGWDDWVAAAERAVRKLLESDGPVIVVGQSLGGSIAAHLAAQHPTLAGVVMINPRIVPDAPDVREMLEAMISEGDLIIPGGRPDIAKPDAADSSYRGLPLPALLSMSAGLDRLGGQLAQCTMPLLLMTSTDDHVVPPSDSDHLAKLWGGPVERVALERSFHVATLDHDGELVVQLAVAFGRRVDPDHSSGHSLDQT